MKRISPAGWVIGILYVVAFLVYIPVNARGALSETLLLQTSLDEPVCYPYVVRMLTPASDLKDLWERWIIYGDYHYGYLFYFSSAVAMLPVRLLTGARFTDFTGINLLLLRQLVSVLPMLVACAWMARLASGRRSTWESVGLLVILLTVRGIARTNIQWWHPDGLSILAVVAVFYFLVRDNLRFGRDFLFAAAACGIAAGIKLAGLFFAPVILALLVYGLVKGRLSWLGSLAKAGLFLGVMLLSLVVTNPVVYNAGARQEIMAIQLFKTTELDQGYDHDVSEDYAKGPVHWKWTLTRWFASPVFLAFLAISLIIGCLWGEQKLINWLILIYSLPMAVYLLWFVSVKPDHYWLPIMIPLFSAFFNIPRALRAAENLPAGWVRWGSLAVYGLAVAFVVWNFLRPESGLIAQYQAAMLVPGPLW